jgi:hypothetical protein
MTVRAQFVVLALLLAVMALLVAAAPALVGGKKQGERCLGSAGYSWCEAKNKCLRRWEESCE